MNSSIVTPINDEYQYLQYNEQLRLIHSINDDMFQLKSIFDACNSSKQTTRWINSDETKEIIKELRSVRKCTDHEIIQNRPNLPNELKGIYIHRLLINDAACWANRKYAIYISELLDSYFEQKRNQLQEQINELKFQSDMNEMSIDWHKSRIYGKDPPGKHIHAPVL